MLDKLNHKLKQNGFQLLSERELIILKFIINMCNKQEKLTTTHYKSDQEVEMYKRTAEQRFNLLELNNFKWCENQKLSTESYGRIVLYYTYTIDQTICMDTVVI